MMRIHNATSVLLVGFAALGWALAPCSGFGVRTLLPRTQQICPRLGRFAASADTYDAESSAGPTKYNKATLLQQARQFLTASQMVYLYAELRELSYCGFLETDYDDLNCNRDDLEVTSVRLLRVMLEEREWAKKEGDKFRSDADLMVNLEEMVKDLPASATGSQKAKDLIELKKVIKKIKSNAQMVPQKRHEERGGAVGFKDAGIKGQILGSVFDLINPQNADDPVVTMVETFSKEYLGKNSMFNDVLKGNDELVDFHDRYASKECLYAITVDREKKMISVTFRGSAIFNDWVENIQIIQKEVENPSDKTGEKIGLHYGFYNILQRERKDSRKKEDGSAGTKVNRIIEKIMTRIKENSSPGEKWTLCTTGHSLGGALCTMFGFYAAADKRVQENVKLPVQVFSFASPKCGDFRFRKAFKLLEQEGKLVHARFCVAEDFVPMIPNISPDKVNRKNVLDATKWKFSFYEHVGLHIKLHKTVGKGGNKMADVYYPSKDNTIAYLKEGFGSNTIRNLPNILDAGTSHSLSEYQERLLDEIEREKETGENKLDKLLVDYYAFNNYSEPVVDKKMVPAEAEKAKELVGGSR